MRMEAVDTEVTISNFTKHGMAHVLPRPGSDALRDADALLGAQLVALELSVTTSIATLLFDLRQADIGQDGNTAILIARSTQAVRWGGKPWLPGWLAWNVGTSAPPWTDNLFTLDLEFEYLSQSVAWPRCVVVAKRAEYYVGDVPSLPEAPPDFGADDEESIYHGMVTWTSAFVPRYMSVVP
jgi:hypothetical protein